MYAKHCFITLTHYLRNVATHKHKPACLLCAFTGLPTLVQINCSWWYIVKLSDKFTQRCGQGLRGGGKQLHKCQTFQPHDLRNVASHWPKQGVKCELSWMRLNFFLLLRVDWTFSQAVETQPITKTFGQSRLTLPLTIVNMCLEWGQESWLQLCYSDGEL